jgi:hypothetical protein
VAAREQPAAAARVGEAKGRAVEVTAAMAEAETGAVPAAEAVVAAAAAGAEAAAKAAKRKTP